MIAVRFISCRLIGHYYSSRKLISVGGGGGLQLVLYYVSKLFFFLITKYIGCFGNRQKFDSFFKLNFTFHAEIENF